MPSTRPRDEITAAVIDAVTSLEMAEDGSVPRSDLKEKAVRREVFANLALARYLEAHPGPTDLSEGERYNAIEDGLGLLAGDAVIWLLDKGHLEEPEPGRVRLTGKQVKINGKKYAPGTNREADLFHSMRRVTPARVDLIRESIAELGDLRQFFPVLVDSDGEVVDGRHRRAVDPNWPASRATVPTDARLAVATAANRSNAWTKDDWQRLIGHRQHAVGRREAVRIAARLALVEDASRSDRVIGTLIGCDNKTVGDVRAELEQSEEIPHFDRPGGIAPGGAGNSGAAQYDKEGLRREIEQLRRADRPVDRKTLAAKYGCGVATVQSMRSQVDALLAAEREVEAPPISEAVIPIEASEGASAAPDEAHAHDWGPYMRQCAECGETEEKSAL